MTSTDERASWWSRYLVRKIMKLYDIVPETKATIVEDVAFLAIDAAILTVASVHAVVDRVSAAGEAVLYGREGVRR
jgi:hypothetical protein